MCMQLCQAVRRAHAKLTWRAAEYTWIFGLTVVFAFIAAFGIGALHSLPVTVPHGLLGACTCSLAICKHYCLLLYPSRSSVYQLVVVADAHVFTVLCVVCCRRQ